MLVSLLFSLQQFESIIMGYEILIITDCSALKYIGSGAKNSSKLLRWSLAIQKYNPTIMSIRGELNIAADCISRML